MANEQSLSDTDQALRACFPLIEVPVEGAFRTPGTCQSALLLTQRGLKLRLQNEAFTWVTPIGLPSPIPLPYGDVDDSLVISFKFEPVQRLLSEFVDEAKRNLPNECGAWITWSPTSDAYRLIHLTTTRATQDILECTLPRLNDGELLLVDVHSHGHAGAFFSRTDDEDDRKSDPAPHFAWVIGGLHHQDPTFLACHRMVGQGLISPDKHPPRRYQIEK